MKLALLILLLGLVAWASGRTEDIAVATSAANSAACAIAGSPSGEVPKLAPSPIAELLPSQMPNLDMAYFSMGCFWGSEAMLGSCPGVMFTRVGFTGGKQPDPSYSAIGDHVETVEVSYDPAVISYQQLLDHFWAHHNAHAKPIFRQYASAIFTMDEGQDRLARVARGKARRSGDQADPLTAIIPLEKFYPAEAAHQKYYLSGDPDLLAQLPRYSTQKLETRLATKLNALAARAGDRSQLKKSLVELGLAEPVSEALLLRASWPAKPARP